MFLLSTEIDRRNGLFLVNFLPAEWQQWPVKQLLQEHCLHLHYDLNYN